ncbi:MAG: AAA family ATPase [bacterium]|nr:AAA family ATPase [bacterium]
MKEIVAEMNSKLLSRATHCVLLYLNTADSLIDQDKKGEIKLSPLINYVLSNSCLSKAEHKIFFTRGFGIHFTGLKEEARFLEILAKLKPEEIPLPDGGGVNIAVDDFRKNRGSLSYAISLFNELLETNNNSDKSTPFFIVVFNYVETLIPPNAACSSCSSDRDALVMVLSLARNSLIREAGNFVVMLTDSLSSVDPKLRSETNGIFPIKVPFPGQNERKLVYANYSKKLAKGSLRPDEFSRLSGGVSLNVIDGIVREAILGNKPITQETIFDKKNKYIKEVSGGLLEVIEPIFDLDTIGALDTYKEFIRELEHDFRRGNLAAIPMGVLLLGAPGTCKSLFAQVIAYILKMPFLRMKNTREMWLGQSERNLEFSLEIIIGSAPAVVFIDEIDQQLQARMSAGDNTGTGQRMQSRLFEIMSDTSLRGKVLWLAASNRPDLIDPAQMREGRFDLILPFFPPSTKKEILDICLALLHKMELKAGHDGDSNFRHVLKKENLEKFSERTHYHVKEDKIMVCNWDEYHMSGMASPKDEEAQILFTGAQVEEILRRAYAIASRGKQREPLSEEHLIRALNDFPVSRNVATYERMTEVALSYCNSKRFVPKEGRWAKIARGIGASGVKTVDQMFSSGK